MDVTLENVLRKHFNYSGVGVGGPGWVKAYQQMIDALYSIGAVTGETDRISHVVGVLDKIDSQDGEI